MRLMWESVADLLKRLELFYPDQPCDRARLQSAFGSPLYLHLSRNDKVAQAVSRLMAEQTGLGMSLKMASNVSGFGQAGNRLMMPKGCRSWWQHSRRMMPPGETGSPGRESSFYVSHMRRFPPRLKRHWQPCCLLLVKILLLRKLSNQKLRGWPMLKAGSGPSASDPKKQW